MSPAIPGITVITDKKYKRILDETLIKSKIIIDHLDGLMREAMGEDEKKARVAFYKLGNIVNSIERIGNESSRAT